MYILIYLLVLLSAILNVTCVYIYDYKTACDSGRPIKIPIEGQILLTYYSSHPLPPNTTCTVSVYNPVTTYPPSVIAYFRSFQTDYTPGCVNSRMDIFNGLGTDPKTALTGPTGMCGTKDTDIEYYNTTDQYITFMFKDDKAISNFRIVLTAAHSGSCHSGEYDCTNGLCIRHSLVCNGYNNCGNDIDELVCVVVLAAGTIVAIVFGALVGVVCIPTVVVCLICHYRRPRRMVYRRI